MKKYWILIFMIWGKTVVFAQKNYTLQDCEGLFLKNNLILLASHFNIEASKAMTMQAKIWDNPVISGDLNVYNPEAQKYWDVGTQGAKSFEISQIIYLGGKKRNEVKLSKINEQIAELEFADLLRNLKFQLRNSFFDVYYNNKTLETTEKQMVKLKELINSYDVQTQKGNVALKELVRLEALYLNFKNERLDLIEQNLEAQSNLRLLLSENEDVNPVLNPSDVDKYNKDLIFDATHLEKQAFENRPDYLIKQKEIEANELNIKFQKSLAIPDITLGASYTQRGGAFDNQKNVNFSIPLPLWNKNKGNIQLSKTILEQSKAEITALDFQLKNEITSSWKEWHEAKSNFMELKPTIYQDLELVYKGILDNFQKRNISLLEFTDFMESFNQANIQYNDMKKKVVITGEKLNNTVNKELF